MAPKKAAKTATRKPSVKPTKKFKYIKGYKELVPNPFNL